MEPRWLCAGGGGAGRATPGTFWHVSVRNWIPICRVTADRNGMDRVIPYIAGLVTAAVLELHPWTDLQRPTLPGWRRPHLVGPEAVVAVLELHARTTLQRHVPTTLFSSYLY